MGITAGSAQWSEEELITDDNMLLAHYMPFRSNSYYNKTPVLGGLRGGGSRSKTEKMTLSLHKSSETEEKGIFAGGRKMKGQEKYRIYHSIIRISRRPNKERRFSLSYRPERIISAAQIAELEF